MKIKNLILMMIVSMIISCQNRGNRKKYSIDYKGKSLSSSEVKMLFDLELKKFDESNNTNGKISIVKTFPITEENNVKEKTIKNLLTKKYYKIKDELTSLNETDFITYYNSLNDENKHSLISSNFIINYFSLTKETNNILKKIILKEFDRFEGIPKFKYKNSNQVNKLKFLIASKSPDFKEEILKHLNNVDVEDYNRENCFFILELGKIDENLALDYFIKILLKQNNLIKQKGIKQYQLISTSNKFLITNFILSKNKKVRDRFIDISIETLNQDIYSPSYINIWISILWNSQKLNNIQKMNIVKALKNSKNLVLVKSSENYKSNLLGIKYLKTINITTDSVNIDNLVGVAKTQLSTKEKEKLLNFIKKNEASLKNNSQNFQIRRGYLENLLKQNTSIQFYKKVFSDLGYKQQNNEFEDSMRYEYLTEHIYGEEILPKDFTKHYLNTKFISSFTSDIRFDTETGVFPNNYPELINLFHKALKKHHNIDIVSSQIVNYTNDKKDIISYEVYIRSITNNKTFKIELEDTGDWYATKSIINVLNIILKENDKKQRFINVNTSDQTSRFILMEPASFLILDKKININEEY